jgi:hypothetical protein
MGSGPFQRCPITLALLVVCIPIAEGARAKTLTFTLEGQHDVPGRDRRSEQPGGCISVRGEILRDRHRALLAFALADSIPAGSVVNAVTLTLHDNRTPPFSIPRPVTLHRVLADWGEGGSRSGVPGGGNNQDGGQGAPAQVGDTTWVHTFFATGLWAHPGGDFVAAASASTEVADIGF